MTHHNHVESRFDVFLEILDALLRSKRRRRELFRKPIRSMVGAYRLSERIGWIHGMTLSFGIPLTAEMRRSLGVQDHVEWASVTLNTKGIL